MNKKTLFLTVIGAALLTGAATQPRAEEILPDETIRAVMTNEQAISEQTYTMNDLLANIDNFVTMPEGGTPWQLFGKTEQKPYAYTDAEGMQWEGVRPIFTDELKKLDGQNILIQGYMFPLDPEEKQSTFLLGPFPVSCPFHYHVTPNLIIEIHAAKRIAFSYDPIKIRGRLELVPKDDEYNVFFRIQNANFIP